MASINFGDVNVFRRPLSLLCMLSNFSRFWIHFVWWRTKLAVRSDHWLSFMSSSTPSHFAIWSLGVGEFVFITEIVPKVYRRHWMLWSQNLGFITVSPAVNLRQACLPAPDGGMTPSRNRIKLRYCWCWGMGQIESVGVGGGDVDLIRERYKKVILKEILSGPVSHI